MGKKPNKGRQGGPPARPPEGPGQGRHEQRPHTVTAAPVVFRPPPPSLSADADRTRLLDALTAARRLRGADIAGLPASLRTLGLGQVLSIYALESPDRGSSKQGNDRSVGLQLARWLARLDASLAGQGVSDVLGKWCELKDRHQVQRIEQETIAWAADLKLMERVTSTSNVDLKQTWPWDDKPRQASAALAADTLLASTNDAKALVPRLNALPREIRHHGLVRALAILHREAGRGARHEYTDPDVPLALATCLYARLAGHPASALGEGPVLPIAVAELLLAVAPGDTTRETVRPRDEALATRLATAAALEHEALAWAVELKRCTVTFHAALAQDPA